MKVKLVCISSDCGLEVGSYYDLEDLDANYYYVEYNGERLSISKTDMIPVNRLNAYNLFNDIDGLVKQSNMSVVERTLKLTEEVGELAEAVLSVQTIEGSGYKKKTSRDLLFELADCNLIIQSLLSQVGYTYEDLLWASQIKMGKWEDKIKMGDNYKE